MSKLLQIIALLTAWILGVVVISVSSAYFIHNIYGSCALSMGIGFMWGWIMMAVGLKIFKY